MTSSKRLSISKERKKRPERYREPGQARVFHTPARDERFLLYVSQGLSVTASARRAGYTYHAVHGRMDRDPVFKAAVAVAHEQGVQMLEDEARRRGFAGVNEPKFHNGEVCGHVRVYSDSLLMFLLKAKRPAVYRENYTISGEIDHRHTHEVVLRNANARAQAMVAEARGLLPAPQGAE